MGQTLFSSFSMQEIITPICNLCLITQTKKNDQYPYFLAGTIWTRWSNRIKTSKWILVNSHEHQEQPVCSSFHSKGEGLECGMEHKVVPPCCGQQRRPGKVTAFTSTSQGDAEVQSKSRLKITVGSAWSNAVKANSSTDSTPGHQQRFHYTSWVQTIQAITVTPPCWKAGLLGGDKVQTAVH